MARIEKRPLITAQGRRNNKATHEIVIRGTQGSGGERFSIVGDMKNQFQYSLSPEWANLFTNLVPGAELLQKIGDASLVTGLFSRKYFKGGGHLAINAEFRIVDKGNLSYNPIVNAARNLSNMVAPPPFDWERTLEQIKSRKELASGEFAQAVEGGLGAGELAQGAYNFLKTLTTSGRTVDCKIGSFFRSTAMIITSLNVTYSREITHQGPLFGDFTVGLETVEALVQGKNASVGVDGVLKAGGFNIMFDGQDAQTGG